MPFPLSEHVLGSKKNLPDTSGKLGEAFHQQQRAFRRLEILLLVLLIASTAKVMYSGPSAMQAPT